MGVNGDHNGATRYDLRSGAHCRIYYRHLSRSLSFSFDLRSLPFSRTHTAILCCIELPTTAVTHDVVDTLNQRWRPRRVRSSSVPPPLLSLFLTPSRLNMYFTMQRDVIPDRRPYPGGIPIAELHYIVAWRKQ